MAEPTALTVPANGLDHRVLEWMSVGAGGGTTIVLVHGYMDAAATWGRVAPHLVQAGHRVLAPDMRGYGDGARAPAGSYYHFSDYVFDLADLVDRLSPGAPVVLVGHSMGGTITTLFGGTFPERVARLVNLEGLGPPDNPWELGPMRMRKWIDGVRRAKASPASRMTRDEALLRLAANHPHVPRDVLEGCLPHLTRGQGDDLVWSFDPLHRTTSPVPFFAKLFVEFAKRVTCPVLFVSGGVRGFHPPDEDERLAAFANVQRAELPNAGHMMHWTEPEAVARLVNDFVPRGSRER